MQESAGRIATVARQAVAAGRLRRWMREQGLPVAGPLDVELLHGGRSNLTYVVGDGLRRWVLRRPPLGHVLASAHDVSREYRVLRGLYGTDVPVPAAIALCRDASVLGAEFCLMEFVDGVVIRVAEDAADLSAAEARRCANALLDTLVAVHRIDARAIGLGDLGRPAGFVERQVGRWRRQWDASLDEPLPGFGELASRLAGRVPPEVPHAIVHGDYRIDNALLNRDDPGRIAAVIDWEMATLGDPRADLGLLLAYWDPVSALVTGGRHAVSSHPGFPGPRELADRYARRAGAALDELPFFWGFGYFKLAAIAQTIRARHARGLAVGDDLDGVEVAIPRLIERGLAVLADR